MGLGAGQATGLPTRSAPLDGLALDAVRERDAPAAACSCCCCWRCDVEAEAALAPPPLPAEEDVVSPRGGRPPASHMSWCSMKLSTLQHTNGSTRVMSHAMLLSAYSAR